MIVIYWWRIRHAATVSASVNQLSAQTEMTTSIRWLHRGCEALRTAWARLLLIAPRSLIGLQCDTMATIHSYSISSQLGALWREAQPHETGALLWRPRPAPNLVSRLRAQKVRARRYRNHLRSIARGV